LHETGANSIGHEGVQFDANTVKAVDWVSYPTIDIKDIPEVNAFIVNPEGRGPDGKIIPPSGAGEPASRPTAAAIANAIFDATGVRLREVPFTPERVKAALAARGAPGTA